MNRVAGILDVARGDGKNYVIEMHKNTTHPIHPFVVDVLEVVWFVADGDGLGPPTHRPSLHLRQARQGSIHSVFYIKKYFLLLTAGIFKENSAPIGAWEVKL